MTNVSEELARLAALRDGGVLTESEFQAQKASVLSNQSALPVEPAKPKKKLGKGCAIVVLLLVIVMIIAIVAAPKGGTAPADQKAVVNEAPPVAVTSVALGKAYEDNEAAAQATYGGKRLAVTGRIEGIQLGLGDAPSVLMTGSNPFLHVQAALADASQSKAAGLKKGDRITVTCAGVSEVVSIPMLSDCEI